MASVTFSVSFSPEILGDLDTMRGDVPRSLFLQRLVMRAKKSGDYLVASGILAQRQFE
jgi:hypothetical protein